MSTIDTSKLRTDIKARTGLNFKEMEVIMALITTALTEQDRESRRIGQLQGAVDIGERIKLELTKKALSSKPPQGTRFMTDSEIIATQVFEYTQPLMSQLQSPTSSQANKLSTNQEEV